MRDLEKKRERDRKYRAANRERERERAAAYRERNKERLKEMRHEWYLANPDRAKRASAEWKKANPKAAAAHRRELQRQPDVKAKRRKYQRAALLKRHGLTPETYSAMIERQGGGCGVCGSTTPQRSNTVFLHIDHCHKTGNVRGILCSKCNTALGLLADDAALFERAIAYLRSAAA